MATTSDHPSLDLRELLRVLARRKLMLGVPWAIALAIGIAAAVLLPPIYFSNVTMVLEQPQALSQALGGLVTAGNPERQADIMRDEVQSTSFLKEVVTASGLKSDPQERAWALKNASGYPGSQDDKIEAYLVDQLRNAIHIQRAKGGNTFQVTVEDRKPQRAQRLAKAVADEFVLSSKAAQLEAVRATQEFSSEQQQIYKQRLEDSEARLEAYKRTIAGQTLTQSVVSGGNLERARSLLEQADLDLQEATSRLTAQRQALGERSGDAAKLSSSETNAMTAQLKNLERQIAAADLLADQTSDAGSSARASSARKMSELEIQFTQNAALAFPEASPDTRDALVRYRLADVDLQMKQSGRAYLAGQVGGYEHQVVMSPDTDEQLKKLQGAVDQDQAFYNSFLQQSAGAQITEAFENARVSGRFSVLEPANLPLSPGKPNRPMLILLALVLGGAVGVGTVLVVERQDQSVKNAEEVEMLLGLPVLGAIPRVEELDRQRRRPRKPVPSVEGARDPGLLHRLKTESPLGLEFRRIYLKLTSAQKLPRTLLMTSSTRGEGKTTTTACLSITAAREMQDRILLVDFDLRSPSLHRALGIPSSSWGLAQMLAQRKFDERFVRSTVLPNLDFLGAGKSEKPASELIDTESVDWFFREAASRYAFVFVDSAPTLAVPDPIILGRAVEGVLYVIKAGQTVRKAAEYGVKVQREARENLLGVLMNDAGEILPHYYGYHDAYGYSSEAMAGDS